MLHPWKKPMATFLQRLHSSVPEVAIVDRFDCTVKLLIVLDCIKLYEGVGLGFNYNTMYHWHSFLMDPFKAVAHLN